jgi:hypothetical protein
MKQDPPEFFKAATWRIAVLSFWHFGNFPFAVDTRIPELYVIIAA